ncbi:hypothetical protein CONCODRAFT_78157 [Conidiobolus coronatus NRRL 28638]|uniref:Uncharacterized protein n=1 Tax=Conidiobolus coronatus (strain ATCC 28846 / CBS 209.66 / NRRL 28638) TaxID=796925 RepID=A0A137P9Y9_CONC2|nr:hypothetical protein CONCODRAFT_78157 [Conidiobolus coronatus NRRL 28638]|eukprot:KXN71792.1 hypothetical protein CONCODRAFT_78157 [Conidiobolus coronatus NRRL 28638]
MAFINRSALSSFIVHPLSSFHILLFSGVISYFLRKMLEPQFSAIGHSLILISLLSVWLGMILSISFMESWVKFLAPSITLLSGVDAGRHVFSVLNKCEIVVVVALLHLLEMQWSSVQLQDAYNKLDLEWLHLLILLPISLVCFLQTCWLLPALLSKSQQVIANASGPSSNSNSGGNTNTTNTNTNTNTNATRNLSSGRGGSGGRSFSHSLYVLTEIVKVISLTSSLSLIYFSIVQYVKQLALNPH